MSASPPIASELWRCSETTRCARSRHMQCSKRPVNLGAFGQALGLLRNYNLAPADEKDPRMTALRRRRKLCYGSFLKIHPRFQAAAALRAADTGDDAERGGCGFWMRSHAPSWGAARAGLAAAARVFAQESAEGGAAVRFYEKGAVRIHDEEAGSGFPLLLIAGGGLNSTISALARAPFNPIEEFKGEYRCIAADL